MTYRMASSPQYGASSSTDFGNRGYFNGSSAPGFSGHDASNLAQSPSQSVQSLRKNAREVERRLGEAIDAVSTSIENAPFDVVQLQLRDAQALLDQVRSYFASHIFHIVCVFCLIKPLTRQSMHLRLRLDG